MTAPKIFAKTLTTELDSKGRETAKTNFATAGGPPDKMYVSPNQAIPIVFVPGIMASPLIATGKDNKGIFDKQNGWAWFPDDWKWMGITGKGYNNLSPGERRLLLDPANTKAVETPKEGDAETLRDFLQGKSFPYEEAHRRGWGSVMIDAYGDILNFLEHQLRFIFYQGHPYPGTYQAIPNDPTSWGELAGYEKLDEAQLKKAAAWRYPVYAVGYNWLRSNREAADYLKNKVEEILNDCRTRMNLKCEQVILVSHSMGGLVTRMYAKHNPDRVLGIVHGVQPATGAGTAYRRVRAGWEDLAGRLAIGANAAEITPVFANGSGPLELLPNHLYGNGWLRAVHHSKGGEQAVLSLPVSGDPYKEIYMQPKHWWRLFNPTLISPENRNLDSSWEIFTRQLRKASSFHYDLGDYYHPNTFTHYGADTARKAFHRITWRLTPLGGNLGAWRGDLPADEARDLQLKWDNLQGACHVFRPIARAGQQQSPSNPTGQTYMAMIDGQDNEGDSTVPGHSGQAPSNHSKFCAKMKGFGHQGSYSDPKVQALTLYSILKIAQTAKVPA